MLLQTNMLNIANARSPTIHCDNRCSSASMLQLVLASILGYLAIKLQIYVRRSSHDVNYRISVRYSTLYSPRLAEVTITCFKTLFVVAHAATHTCNCENELLFWSLVFCVVVDYCWLHWFDSFVCVRIGFAVIDEIFCWSGGYLLM